MDNFRSFSISSSHLTTLRTFVEAVQTGSDSLQVGEVATTILREVLGAHILALYQPVPTPPVFHLLACAGQMPASRVVPSFDLSFWASFLGWIESQAQDTVLLLNDVHASDQANPVAPLLDPGVQSCLCLPLWCQGTLEGVLIAEFVTCPAFSDADLVLVSSCGWHLADALSRTRWPRAIERERREHRYFSVLLDQLPEGMVLAEASAGCILYANPIAARILGIDEQCLLGVPAHTLYQPASPGGTRFFWAFALIRALSGEMLHRVEGVVVRPDQTQVPVVCSSAPLRTTPGGTITGAMLILQDITAQKQLERYKNSFLAHASHELRTPLTSVLGYAEILAELASEEQMDLLPAQVSGAATRILTEAEQMSFLIDGMLDLASLDLDQLTLECQPCDLRQLLTVLVEAQARTTTRHHLDLVLDEQTRSHGCIAQVDEMRLTQALRNLVINAIKYTPQGGRIEIGLHQEGQTARRARLWVGDPGLGIAREDLPHLFERFYRSSHSDPSISGLGLGLYMVKQIIARHSGCIRVESCPGHGSTFSILLPL